MDIALWQQKVQQNMEQIIVGKPEVLRWTLICIACEGHLLLEDVPGVGKTMLARAIASSLGCSFHRVQCTPDLLPSDVTGVTVFDPRGQEFVFHQGPLFAQVVLVDEINRATPRTQAALLEAMAEHQVTIDGKTYPLPQPFFVIATQNPVEFAGTFPLPEAQLDRFFMRLQLGYPARKDEMEIFQRYREGNPLTRLEAVTTPEELLQVQRQVREVFVHEDVIDYAVQLVAMSRERADVLIGASPRGTLSLLRAAQALAAMEGRKFVLPDDVKQAAPQVLAHRFILSPESELRGSSDIDIVHDLLLSVDPPVERSIRD